MTRKPWACLSTVTPIWRVWSGSLGVASATRFCTSTWAWARSAPGRKVTVMVTWPFEDDEDMYSIFSTPLISCSSGAATVSARVSAEAPGKKAVTVTPGGAISGYCDSGSSG
jgi:hypothetical protein